MGNWIKSRHPNQHIKPAQTSCPQPKPTNTNNQAKKTRKKRKKEEKKKRKGKGERKKRKRRGEERKNKSPTLGQNPSAPWGVWGARPPNVMATRKRRALSASTRHLAWSCGESNPGPSRCERDALPTALQPLVCVRRKPIRPLLTHRTAVGQVARVLEVVEGRVLVVDVHDHGVPP